MGAGGPQAVADEDGEGAHHLVAHTGVGPLAQLFRMVEVQAAQQAFLQRVNQVERPEAEGEVGADEIGEAEHQEVDAESQSDALAQQFQLPLPRRIGHGGKIVIERFHTAEDEGYGQADPHQPIAEKGFEQAPGFVLGHCQRHLG